MERIYLDSNVFIAFIKSELGKGFKLMEQDVEDFFAISPEKYLLVLSDHTIREIQKIVYYTKEDVFQILQRMKIKLQFIETTEED